LTGCGDPKWYEAIVKISRRIEVRVDFLATKREMTDAGISLL
jgi:hypothetical protein